jgi:tetratricopeptide (TPR) repeat protein
MPESVKKSFVIFTYFVLILSTLLVFWQVRNFDFVGYDDNDYVYENPHVLNGLTEDGVIWAFTTNCSANWHPLTWLSLMLDCQLFGPGAGRMHLVNVLLHLVNTLLLLAVLKKMTGSLWPSAFVAAAFALHPMHVESVAWIAERKDVLSTLFLLLTLAAYVSYVRRRGLVRYVLTVLLFTSGLLAKPMLVTLPFLLLLLDYWPLNRFVPQTIKASGRQSNKFAPAPNRRRILYQILIEKIPFFALSVVSSVITFLVQRAGGTMADIDILPLHSRVANAFLSYEKYIGKMFWPENLAVLYPLDADSFAFGQVAMCVLLLLVISIFVIRFGRNQKYLPVGWFWFVGTLVPVIGFVQVGIQALADRYTYISYIGLFIMIAWGLPELLSKWTSASSVESPQRKIALGLSMVIVLTILGICTHQQVSYWNNSIALFSHAIKVTQNNHLAHCNLGVAYSSLGRYQDEIESYKQAIRIKPNYAKAHNNLGVAYGRLGRHQEAIDAYKQAIRIKPDYAEAHYGLGVAYGSLGRYQEAIVEAYKQAIRIKPDYADAHYGLGFAYGSLGRYQDAVEAYKQAILIKPDYAEAHYGLGVTYGSLGRYQEAIEAFKQAILIKPDYAEAHCNLGVAYYKLGRYQDAVEAYKQAVRIKPDYAEAHYGLGVAYGSLGRYRDAIDAYKQAIRIRPDYADAHCNIGATYLITGDKGSALEEYKILKTLDAEKANELFKLIYK